MSLPKPKVIVANVFKQHSHQLAYALQSNDMLRCYFTGIWFKPGGFLYKLINLLPYYAKKRICSHLKKRSFENLNVSLIKQIIFPELLYRCLIFWDKNNYLLNVNICFDKIVSKKIQNINFDVFIGYEMGCLECFRYCKHMGKLCVLDLAMVAYNYQLGYLEAYNDQSLSKRIKKEIKQKSEEIELADYIFVPSEIVKSSLLELNVSKDKILKVPYGVNIDLFKPKKYYSKDRKLKILYVGAVEKRKGIEILLEAIKRINSKDIELFVVGKVTDAKKEIKKYTGLFSLLGYLHHDMIVKLYQECDIFVLPSFLEGFSQVIMEAMASGLPVIVSDKTGVSEIIEDGESGFIVPSGDIEKLKEKILYFLHNKEAIEKMGGMAAKRISQYTWENYRKNIVDNILKVWTA
jgi:glycosyltransferase involved in cell wall biosynthesis